MQLLVLSDAFESGTTLSVLVTLAPANKSIRQRMHPFRAILDTGAVNTTLSKDFLARHGYGMFGAPRSAKRTAAGLVEFKTCKIGGLVLSNQFSFDSMVVDVFEDWQASESVGVIGMDILSQMTFILSHEHKKFLLTNEKIPQLGPIFRR
ncbi:MAG: aspartyl protease family protein [Defluviitaleaceae bacterium]|nr:aspartyl protease family protein [Defluviitaleaceae bacterium]